MKCPRCLKNCNKIEVQVWNRCGRCEAQNVLHTSGDYFQRRNEE
jgi:hypothetical protein